MPEGRQMNKKQSAITGAVSGILNGFFGSGGGIAAVPLLEKYGEDIKKAHAESLAIMLPLSAASAAVYFINGGNFMGDRLWIIPAGLAGAAVGGLCMKKISSNFLEKLFAVLLTAAGIRILI